MNAHAWLLLLQGYALLGACSESNGAPARGSISSYAEPSLNIPRTSIQGAPPFTVASTDNPTHGSAQDTINPSPPPKPTGPSPTNPFSNTVTPPIKCPGVYYTQAGVCCSGQNFLGCSWSDVASGQADPKQCCPSGKFVYALPLSTEQISEAEANGTYSGCPGTMEGGLCCSGPVVFFENGQQVCSYGTPVFSVSTAVDGEQVTSSLPSGAASTTTGSGKTGTTGKSSTGRTSATGTATASAASAVSSARALRLEGRADRGLWSLVAIGFGALL
ncbi:hypothetical protein K490DRAFT_65870 [Saccharata proteae CBS 121410]|uniref:Uncharacterized protein n=1 Tax=Saccharata proteae CBS 121410 TaxID=1314787 RepID=A0A9P4LWX2_9PEZI|nr:hypothetical protein K490DRAFT_65870 [Saccharata proteae CBS 121410]